ncbi:formyltetrahydrofolate deformylase [Deminuibacter soli]|nr:formyltetrahydrofolate deformylase [Deminuibacter soli]
MVAVIQCTDRVGLVAAIANVMAINGMNILSMREHVELGSSMFFSRLELSGEAAADIITTQLQQVLPTDAIVQVNPLPQKRIAVLVTKEYHCLGDILLRHHFNTLGASVQCVIGNHALLGDICGRFGIPFHHVPHDGIGKEQFEQNLLTTLLAYQFDYIVLAKFMRILSPAFTAHFPLRIINIHHSFLPAFIGASPYKQAFDRGVKLIGATAHYVTSDLDEGPIIAQQIIPVNHNFTAKDMVHAGREIETAVLARALSLLLADRVFVHNNKTIVFE